MSKQITETMSFKSEEIRRDNIKILPIAPQHTEN